MNSTHIALLAVDAYVITSKDVYEIRQQYKTHPFHHLHPYTINLKEVNDKADNGLIDADYYLQFMGTIEDDDYANHIFFDLNTQDDLLNEEVSNVGYKDLFDGIDFKKILDNFSIPMYKDSWKKLGAPIYLIVEMNYMSSYDHYSGATEYDLMVDIVGYLDSNLEKVIFDPLNINK